jgi:hypothetical protein
VVYGWDGVDNAVLMTGVVRNTPAQAASVDWRTWTFASHSWLPATAPQTLPNVQGAETLLVYDSDRKREVLIKLAMAMQQPGSASSSSVWESDGRSWQQRTTPHAPPQYGTQFASAAYSPPLRATVMIDSGFMSGTGHDLTWIYDGNDWRPLTTRHWPGQVAYMTYDPARQAVEALDNTFNTWVFNGDDWTELISAGGASPYVSTGMSRQGPSVAFDPVREVWVVFGGFDGNVSFDDTWTGRAGGAWTRQARSASPLARSGWPGRTNMVWDPALQRVVLFGGAYRGLTTIDLGDTWSWDGSSWTRLAGPVYPPQPSPAPAPTLPPASAPRLTTPPPLVPPSSSLLFAVVEGAGPQTQAGTVAIVGMDGYAKAKATFQPRTPAYIPDAAVPEQPPAQVIGSSVVYIDGAGVVRQLRVGSQPKVLATITQPASQYETWFAVSPDSSHVIAGVLTLPALGPIPSGAPWPTLVGPWKFDLEAASAGGATTNLLHQESSIAPDAPGATWKPTFPIAWTSGGAIGMVPAYIGTQNVWYGGHLFVLDAAGKQSRSVGGADCQSASITASGFIPCASDQGSVSIRDSAGNTIWAPQTMGFNGLSAYVSPDGKGYSDGQTVETISSGVIILPSHLLVEGWLDDNTVIGRIPTPDGFGDLAWISLGDPNTVHDFGFKGDFVGTVG